MLRQNLKNRYESRSVEKWANAYNKFYASIAAGQTDEDEAEPSFPEEPAEE